MPEKPPDTSKQYLEGVKATSKCAHLPEERRVSVSATEIETPEGPAIHFAVTNVSSQPLNLYAFMLPWGNANAIEVAAVGSDGSIPAVFWPIDDPGPQDPFALAPREKREGDFLLARRVDDLPEARKKTDVLITWCYPFRVIRETRGGCVTGAVLVPKRAG